MAVLPMTDYFSGEVSQQIQRSSHRLPALLSQEPMVFGTVDRFSIFQSQAIDRLKPFIKHFLNVPDFKNSSVLIQNS